MSNVVQNLEVISQVQLFFDKFFHYTRIAAKHDTCMVEKDYQELLSVGLIVNADAEKKRNLLMGISNNQTNGVKTMNKLTALLYGLYFRRHLTVFGKGDSEI